MNFTVQAFPEGRTEGLRRHGRAGGFHRVDGFQRSWIRIRFPAGSRTAQSRTP
jgi:hypothetical protein